MVRQRTPVSLFPDQASLSSPNALGWEPTNRPSSNKVLPSRLELRFSLEKNKWMCGPRVLGSWREKGKLKVGERCVKSREESVKVNYMFVVTE